MSGTGRNRSLFLLEYFDRVPLFVGRGLFIFERALEIHLGQRIIRIKFQEAREQDFSLREITITELTNSFLIRFQPDQQVLIERSVSRVHDGEDIDRFGPSFDLGTRDGAQMKFVANQIRRRRTDKNVHSINARQPFQTRRQPLFSRNNSRRIPRAAYAAAFASLAIPWLLTFPHTAMMPSPMNLSRVPSF